MNFKALREISRGIPRVLLNRCLSPKTPGIPKTLNVAFGLEVKERCMYGWECMYLYMEICVVNFAHRLPMDVLEPGDILNNKKVAHRRRI